MVYLQSSVLRSRFRAYWNHTAHSQRCIASPAPISRKSRQKSRHLWSVSRFSGEIFVTVYKRVQFDLEPCIGNLKSHKIRERNIIYVVYFCYRYSIKWSQIIQATILISSQRTLRHLPTKATIFNNSRNQNQLIRLNNPTITAPTAIYQCFLNIEHLIWPPIWTVEGATLTTSILRRLGPRMRPRILLTTVS